ncbi:MAG: serine protease [Acidobacteria bacterium]|nr:serine protease [Acidobacteriota bacterium]
MTNLVQAISAIRDSVVAVLRVHMSKPAKQQKGKIRPPQFQISLVGTAWCIVDDKYMVTAHHIFNNGKPRMRSDKFYVFTVPQNGPKAFHFPVTNYIHEDANSDIAIIEIGPSPVPDARIKSCPITFKPQIDGAKVLTYGFPAPKIESANVDQDGNWQGGNFFLKAHANEGIVSASYDLDGLVFYELNVGWHHGESGGPIFTLEAELPAVFSIMQHYRNIQAPHGIIPGPHRGRSLSAIEKKLTELGATISD